MLKVVKKGEQARAIYCITFPIAKLFFFNFFFFKFLINKKKTGRGQFFPAVGIFCINKSILVIEVAPKAKSIGFVWAQTTQELSNIKECETFSSWNQVNYSNQEVPRSFTFWTLHFFFIPIEMKVNIKRYVKGSIFNFLG